MDSGVRNLITSAVLASDTIRYRRGTYVLDTKRLCESVEFRVGRLGLARANYSDPTIRKGVNGLINRNIETHTIDNVLFALVNLGSNVSVGKSTPLLSSRKSTALRVGGGHRESRSVKG